MSKRALIFWTVVLLVIYAGVFGWRRYQHEMYLRTHYCAVDQEVGHYDNGDQYVKFRMVTCKEVEESGDPGKSMSTNAVEI